MKLKSLLSHYLIFISKSIHNLQSNFVVQLNNDGPTIEDTDSDIDIDLMDTRLPFLQMCQLRGWKFSSRHQAAVSGF